MPKHHKPHLHTYLDRESIFDIYKLWNDGKSEEEICEMYKFSPQSLNRILTAHNWKKHQRRVWGHSNPPTLTREIHPIPHPFRKVEKVSSVPGEGSKFTADPADPKDYNCKPEGEDLPACDSKRISTNPDSIENLEDIASESTPKDILTRKELMHRLESVQVCFDLMAEEFGKLINFLHK